jgi:hypothetical protein
MTFIVAGHPKKEWAAYSPGSHPHFVAGDDIYNIKRTSSTLCPKASMSGLVAHKHKTNCRENEHIFRNIANELFLPGRHRSSDGNSLGFEVRVRTAISSRPALLREVVRNVGT